MIFNLIKNEINKILGDKYEIYLNESMSSNYGLPLKPREDIVLGTLRVEVGSFKPLAKAQGFETRMSLYILSPCEEYQNISKIDITADLNRLIDTTNGMISAESATEISGADQTEIELFEYNIRFDIPRPSGQIIVIDHQNYIVTELGFNLIVTESLVFGNSGKVYLSPTPIAANITPAALTALELPGLLVWRIIQGQGMEGYFNINDVFTKNLPNGASVKIAVDGLLEKSSIHKNLIANYRLTPQKRYYLRTAIDLGKAGTQTDDYEVVLEESLPTGTLSQFATYSLRFAEVPSWLGSASNG